MVAEGTHAVAKVRGARGEGPVRGAWRAHAGILSCGNIGSTLTFNRLPRQHHEHLKSTNMLELLDEELRRCVARAEFSDRCALLGS